MGRVSPTALFLVAVLLGALPANASETVETSLTTLLSARIKPGTGWTRDIPPRTMFTGEYTEGDTIAYSDTLRSADRPLFDRPKGAIVGRADTILTLTSRTKALFHVQVDLPGGSLRITGRDIWAADTVHLHVVDGSGVFEGARGSTAITQLSRVRALYVIHLRTP